MGKWRPNAPTGQLSAASTASSDLDGHVSADELPGTDILGLHNGKLKKMPKGPRRRQRFPPGRRLEVAHVRRVGACKTCRARKVRCKHALEEKDALPLPLPPPPPPPNLPNPLIEDLNFCGARWPQSGDDQPPAERYNSTLNLDTAFIPPNRLKALQYVEELCTTIVDGAADPSAAPAWPVVAQPMYPHHHTLRLNTHLSPNAPPQDFHSPTTAYSVSTYDPDDAPSQWDQEDRGGAPAYANPSATMLQVDPSSTRGDFYRQQYPSDRPMDEHHPNHTRWVDPNPMRWRADPQPGAGPFLAADGTGFDSDVQRGKWAQVELLLSETYNPGMQDSSVHYPSRSDMYDENMVEMMYGLGRLRTSSRAAPSVSGLSQAGVQKQLPRRRRTNPHRPGDQSYGQPRRLSVPVPGQMHGSRLHETEAMMQAQQPDPRSLQPLQPPLAPQSHQQPSGAWGPPQMYTEHLFPLLGWTQQAPQPAPSPMTPFPSAHGGEGYLHMNDHLSRAQDYSNGSTTLQSLPYDPRSMFPDSDFGAIFPPSGHQSIPTHLQRQPYHAGGASAHVPSASASRHHSRQPSIILNDNDKVIHDPERTFYTDGPMYQEPSSSNALSFPAVPDFSTNHSGSVSSVGNDSLRSVVGPVQAALYHNATSPIDIGGVSSHDGGGHGAHHLIGVDVNKKFMHVAATEVEVQDGDVPKNVAGDDVAYQEWEELWEDSVT